MEREYTIKEALQELLILTRQYCGKQCAGLCSILEIMEDQPNLHRLAFKYLMEHMPAPSFPNRFGHPNMFCWERGNMEVRVDWLKKQIDSLDD